MMLLSILAVSFGASLGAVLRWQLSLILMSLWPQFPYGTLTANLIGGFVVGLGLAYFSHEPSLQTAYRLFLITGFCGGLTTFSTFSAEVVLFLQEGRWALAAATILTNLIGSLIATLSGLMLYNHLFK